MKTVFAQNVDIENSINLNNIFLNINKVLLNNHKSTFLIFVWINKIFNQLFYTKMCHGAKTRDYFGTEEWLKDAGIINISYNLKELELPFSGYELSDYLEFID